MFSLSTYIYILYFIVSNGNTTFFIIITEILLFYIMEMIKALDFEKFKLISHEMTKSMFELVFCGKGMIITLMPFLTHLYGWNFSAVILLFQASLDAWTSELLPHFICSPVDFHCLCELVILWKQPSTCYKVKQEE